MKIILLLIFILSLSIRFLYFPENVNFAYDQARDSFAALDIAKGDLKIIGPPTTVSHNIFHGVLFYYLLAPIFLFTNGNIEIAAGFLRIINALGVFLVFLIGSNIFNKKVGLMAAFLYAISYEQSQQALFFGHPNLGVISVLIFYFGLSILIFKNNPKGLVIALLGLGLAIQAEAVNGFLIFIFLLFIFIYRQSFLINFKILILSLGVFLLININYILSELKYDFRTIRSIIDLIGSHGNNFSAFVYPSAVKRFIHDNLLANDFLVNFILVAVVFVGFYYFRDKILRPKIIFLLIWFFGGLLPYFFATSFSYYYAPGASVGLLILIAFLIDYILRFAQDDNRIIKVFVAVLIIVIFLSNLSLILTQNKNGVNSDIVIQRGMILGNQKKVLDYIYEKSEGESFAINALTVPLNVKTTWDYLFNWIGKEKYGSLPIWAGPVAEGFPGKLKVEDARDKLSAKHFTIIEPTTGIEQRLIDEFINNENYFSKVLEEKDFGAVKVQLREKI